MVTDRRTGTGSGGRHKSRPALLAVVCLALAIAPLAGCQGEARTKVDCDQMLNEGKYDVVIQKCDDPFQLSSAYLGKGGFDVFTLINSTAPDGKVAQLLGLTAANVNERRLLFNKALEVVNPPHGGNQAFALLIASFLGMAVTTEQFLDNGGGGNTALDDTIASGETQAALNPVSTTLAMAVQGGAHFAVMLNGKSYILDCTAATPPCGGDATTLVYDDPDGSGLLTTAVESTDKTTVLAGVASFTSAAYVAQVTDIGIGVGLSSATREPSVSYIGTGDPAGTFNIGLSAYLTDLGRATTELETATGSTGGSDVTAQINAIQAQLDNGASCASSDPVVGPLVAMLNQFYVLYRTAAGTNALAATGNYANNNLVAATDIPLLLVGYPLFGFPSIPGPLAFTATTYKLLFATQAGVAAYDLMKATPRVDQSFSTLQNNFEDIPLFAPDASPAGDDNINLVEVLCAAG